MAGVVSPARHRVSWLATLTMGIASAVFFVLVGEPERIPWLVIVLSLIYVGYLLRGDRLMKRRPRSKEDAFREACFAFGFTALLMFSFGNFATPEQAFEPLRMSLTMGLSWGVVAYRLSRGYRVYGWRLFVTLMCVAIPVTLLTIAGLSFFD